MSKRPKTPVLDAHVYGGALLVAVGFGLWLSAGAGLVAFGVALFALGRGWV